MQDFIPYGKQWIEQDDIDAVTAALQNDFLTQGPTIEAFEKKIGELTGAKYCIAVSNGTAALHMAVASLDIEPGKAGMTTPNTFVASSNCFLYNGLRPVFADINPKTYNIDIEQIKASLTDDVNVIVVVDFAGQPAEMEAIYNLAQKKGIAIIEDASHAIGSAYSNKQQVGSCTYSDMTVFSFHPVKTITTGEGGAVTTNSETLYEKLKLLRTHGITKDKKFLTQVSGTWYYEMQMLGFNYRLTDIQAALGLSQLNKLQKFVDRRREIVDMYNKSFAGMQHVITPFENPNVQSAFHLYVLQINFKAIGNTRAHIMEQLHKRGVGTQVHYIPVHMQPYYKEKFGYKQGDFPISEAYYEKALSIPLYPKMSAGDVEHVIKSIKEVLNSPIQPRP